LIQWEGKKYGMWRRVGHSTVKFRFKTDKIPAGDPTRAARLHELRWLNYTAISGTKTGAYRFVFRVPVVHIDMKSSRMHHEFATAIIQLRPELPITSGQLTHDLKVPHRWGRPRYGNGQKLLAGGGASVQNPESFNSPMRTTSAETPVRW